MRALPSYRHAAAALGLAGLLALAACAPWPFAHGPSAASSDAVVDIDQARALQGSLVAGDAQGFPLVLARPGRYRLTSDLVVPAGCTGVQITAEGVTLDLNGFTVRGPGVQGTDRAEAHGIVAQAPGAVVRHGSVQGFAGMGVVLQSRSRVEDLAVTHNGAHGVHANTSASQPVQLVRVRATHNGGDGFWLQTGEIAAAHAEGNGRSGFALGALVQWRDSHAQGNLGPDGNRIDPAPREGASAPMRLRRTGAAASA